MKPIFKILDKKLTPDQEAQLEHLNLLEFELSDLVAEQLEKANKERSDRLAEFHKLTAMTQLERYETFANLVDEGKILLRNPWDEKNLQLDKEIREITLEEYAILPISKYKKIWIRKQKNNERR